MKNKNNLLKKIASFSFSILIVISSLMILLPETQNSDISDGENIENDQFNTPQTSATTYL